MPDSTADSPAQRAGISLPAVMSARIPVIALGMSLGVFFAATFVLCVGFDLLFPGMAMYETWLKLLPGFTWLSLPSFFLGLAESFAYVLVCRSRIRSPLQLFHRPFRSVAIAPKGEDDHEVPTNYVRLGAVGAARVGGWRANYPLTLSKCTIVSNRWTRKWTKRVSRAARCASNGRMSTCG